MTGIGGTARFVVYRTDDAHQSVAAVRPEGANRFGQRHPMDRRITTVADVAGLVLDVGDRVDLDILIGKLDLPPACCRCGC